MSEHTFGPWVVGRTLRDGEPCIVGDGDSVVCSFGDRTFPEADARLIASAPDLLEACIQAEAAIAGLDFDGCPEALAVIRAAIAKAQGLK